MGSGDIDVVVPVFNGEKYIANALRSIQEQTLPASRIIIANDGSTDRTARIIEIFKQSDNRITHLQLPHGGVSSARNAGISVSSASFIAFLDADDIWLPEKLERQMKVFTCGAGEAGFVHSSYFFIDVQGERMADQEVFPPKRRGDIFMPLLFEGYVLSGSASSVLVRRDVLDKAGYFDERLFHGEDWDLWIRLAKVSKVDFTPEAVVGIRVHGQSAQRRATRGAQLQFLQQQLIIYSKWEGLCTRDQRFKAALRQRTVGAALAVLRDDPRGALKFYRSLVTSESVLARSLFSNVLDFWIAVGGGIFDVLVRRLKRRIDSNDSEV